MSTGLPKFDYPCLLGDIGGTNARFALFIDGAVTQMQVLNGGEFATIADAARAYLSQVECDSPRAAAIDIAAPLTGDEVRMTNHNWQFSIAALRKELNLERLILLNDFTALAMSLRHLPRDEVMQLGGAQAVADASIALIGPGTGLGVSGLIPSNGAWTPLQGEGGHVSLPACNERESAVIAVLRKRFTHVSAERAISGPGLVNVYSALCLIDGIADRDLHPNDITARAMANSDAQCVEALQLFCAMLGSVAGDLALTLGAVGGVYIGGGIVPRLGEYFARSEFRARFEDKGRYRNFLSPIPVYVIHSTAAAFYGLSRAFVDSGPRLEAT